MNCGISVVTFIRAKAIVVYWLHSMKKLVFVYAVTHCSSQSSDFCTNPYFSFARTSDSLTGFWCEVAEGSVVRVVRIHTTRTATMVYVKYATTESY
jgi:hypothetical protein